MRSSTTASPLKPPAASPKAPPSSKLRPGDLIPDAALKDPALDSLDHAAVAGVLSDLVLSVTTPANIALFGPWGSGKSSVYGMMKARITATGESSKNRIKVVRYDAWKYAGHSLQRDFLREVAGELDLPDNAITDALHSSVETARLRLGKFLKTNWWPLLGATSLAALASALWALVATAWAVWVAPQIQGLPAAPAGFPESLLGEFPKTSVVFAAVLAALVISSQAMSSAVERRTVTPIEGEDQFFSAFDELLKSATKPRKLWQWKSWQKKGRLTRLVIFVDELDRCGPDDVVTTLTSLLAFLDQDKCVFVVAADREVLEEALERTPQVKVVREHEPYYSTAGAFLDKVFQHQLTLPPTRPEALTAYAMRLADKQGGIWAELRQDRRRYEDVVYSLVPAHIRSPRRVKVLMNNFATSIRAAQARRIDISDRAVEIAVLTVLQTEFPSVARDFLRQPLLLTAIADGQDSSSEELRELANAYTPGVETEDKTGSASPATFLSQGPGDSTAESSARERLKQQLHGYLGKIRAAGITLPCPDLIYLQPAGHAVGLSDPGLARVLDLAADTAPDELVGEMDGVSPTDKAAAVKYLATKASETWGPARANLVESACRIAYSLPVADARDAARVAASTLLSEARNGRWRQPATIGAIWLGLLDDQIAHPLDPLKSAGVLDEIAADGVLEGLLPRMHELPRAELLYPFICEAYPNSPDLLQECLGSFPAAQAVALWTSAREKVRTAILVPAPPLTQRAPKASDPSALYVPLLDALLTRSEPDTDQVVAEVASLALDTEAQPALYDHLQDSLDPLLDSMKPGPIRDDLCLRALLVVPHDDLAPWAAKLDLESSPDQPLAAKVAQRLLALKGAEGRLRPSDPLSQTILRLVPHLAEVQCESLAQDVLASMIEFPPDGQAASQEHRTTLRRVLRTIEKHYPEPRWESAYLSHALAESARRYTLTHDGVPQASAEVESLAASHAVKLDSDLASIKGEPDQIAPGTRLRIVARTVASLGPLPVGDVLQALPSHRLVTEWTNTNPPLPGVLRLRSQIKLAPDSLRDYAAARNTRDRTKLWIALERKGDPISVLEAVGAHGLSALAVNHMTPRVVSAPLVDQTAAVRRLATADLSNRDAQIAVDKIVVSLLASRLAGAGSNAAKLAIAARGTLPSRRAALRHAFDNYTNKVTNHQISKADLTQLVDLGLLTKVETSPLAKLLGWLGA
ncbi:MAG TPA: P-loop NTPase fold protein [Propionicimonas sp.]|nr:P-loop NTPase fold protein [Propionicimonas sp.]